MPPVPRVSVIVPVYNRRDAIRPTLDSVSAQTYADCEVVVVDDGSTDDVLAMLRADYPNVRTIRLERNSGVSVARNRGVAAAHGELIAFLDSDDLWSPDKLTLQVEDFDRHPEAVLSFTDITFGVTGTSFVYSVTQPFQPERVFEQLLEGGPILPSAVMVRKSHFDATGGFDPDVTPAEDRDLWLRLAPLGPFRFLPLPLVRRVVYPDAESRPTERWEASLHRVVARFLDRPEGAPYRDRAGALRAFQFVKVGSRHLQGAKLFHALTAFSRATVRDPRALVRPTARRLLARACEHHVKRLVKWSRAARFRRRVGRLFGWSPGLSVKSAVAEPAGEFRPPPDASSRM